MIVVFVTAGVLAVVLLWTLYAEPQPLADEQPVLRPWTDLPTPAQIRRTDFRLAVAGYDRRAVEAHLDRVARAYETVLRARVQVAEVAAERTEPAPSPESGEPPSSEGDVEAG